MYPSGLPHIEVRSIAMPSGIALRVLESGPTSGPPVVLVHGWGACVYTFRYTIEALAAAGRRVVAFDLRGHGLSEKPAPASEYQLDRFLTDLAGLLDSCSLARPDIVGHSLGGGFALHFALRYPERIGRLVLAAPVGLTNIPLQRIARLLTPRFTTRASRMLTPRWLTSFLVHYAYGEPRRVTDQIVEQYWAPTQFPNYYRATRALLHRVDWRPFDANVLARVSVPTLVILGSADRLIPGAETGARAIRGAIIVKIEGGGHLGIEERPQEFNAALLRFTNSC